MLDEILELEDRLELDDETLELDDRTELDELIKLDDVNELDTLLKLDEQLDNNEQNELELEHGPVEELIIKCLIYLWLDICVILFRSRIL